MKEGIGTPQEQFFPGFIFKAPRPFTNELLQLRSLDDPDAPIEIIPVFSRPTPQETPVAAEKGRAVERPRLWEFPEVIATFKEVCDRIENDNGDIFAKSYDFQLVDAEELVPKNEAEYQEAIERYGEYVLDETAGICSRTEDNKVLIQIGFKGRETTFSELNILTVLFHEMGHSLGDDFLESTLHEEMKAYAFTNLCLRYYFRVDYAEDLDGPLLPDRLHDRANFNVIQLAIHGVKEEAILAHLTGRNFGEYTPESWKEMIK